MYQADSDKRSMDRTIPTEWRRQLLDPDNLTIVPLQKSTTGNAAKILGAAPLSSPNYGFLLQLCSAELSIVRPGLVVPVLFDFLTLVASYFDYRITRDPILQWTSVSQATLWTSSTWFLFLSIQSNNWSLSLEKNELKGRDDATLNSIANTLTSDQPDPYHHPSKLQTRKFRPGYHWHWAQQNRGHGIGPG